MENEQRHYELRSGSRSRSRTPLVQNRVLIEPETLEHHYDLRSRSRERSSTPGEVTSNRRSGSRSLPSSSSKINDQRMDTVIEGKKEVVTIATMSEGENKQIENSLISVIRKGERRSERQKARRQIFSNGQAENKEDSCRRKNEKACKSISPHRTFTSDYSSEEGEQQDLSNKPSSAHEIYKQAGDWWNVFPKTDYTYSERSLCRYEIAPGVLAMPNMSRRSIHSDTDGFGPSSHVPVESGIYETGNVEKAKEIEPEIYTPINELHKSHISNLDGKSKVRYTTRHVEQYRRHREIIYTEPKSLTNLRTRQASHSDLPLKRIDSRKYDVTSFVDSDAELEEAISNNQNEKSRRTQRFTSFTSVIVLWFSKLLEFLKLRTIKSREHCSTYQHQRYESKWFRIWECIDHSLQYVYLFMVRVFFFDSWLLSRVFSIRRWMHRKGPNILWIALLPLLLLIGYWCLPYLSALLLSTKAITRQFKETPELVTSNKRLFLRGELVDKGDDFELNTETLNSRINSLEDRTIQQSDLLFNISEALEQLRESEYLRSKYDNEILIIEKGLSEHKLADTYIQEIDAIKSQFERLKELYSELKLCCDTRMKYVIIEDLKKHMDMVLTDYFEALMSNREEAKVRGKTSITKNNIITDDRVRAIVKEALKIYDADKTGRVDYALESAGGQIISTRCTQRYDIKTRAFKLLAFTLYHENNNPRTVIQGNPIQPGACWAFQGFPGYLLIKLRGSVYVTGFTVEHAPKSILPNGEMRSAPKKFNVWGFIDENDSEPVMFGDYEFVASDDSLQYFPIQNTTINTPYEYIELRVHSNHGQLEYTCLYRFRVHGRQA